MNIQRMQDYETELLKTMEDEQIRRVCIPYNMVWRQFSYMNATQENYYNQLSQNNKSTFKFMQIQGKDDNEFKFGISIYDIG